SECKASDSIRAGRLSPKGREGITHSSVVVEKSPTFGYSKSTRFVRRKQVPHACRSYKAGYRTRCALQLLPNQRHKGNRNLHITLRLSFKTRTVFQTFLPSPSRKKAGAVHPL
ncbi:unnamed protein product, partial [Ectocarpus sp. 12 AP-2014]